jgi:hypothetical protein
VQVTSTSLSHLVSQFVSDPSVVQGLNDKLSAIATAASPTAKAGMVGAFISQVQAQTGKSITAANAAILIQMVSAL